MTVGIVGAGISGLALTHQLRKRGVDCVTFEATGEPGGVIRSRDVDGRVVEAGPQRLRLTPVVEEYVETFGLEDDLYEGNDDHPLYIYQDGGLRVAPLSVREAVTTDLLSWRGKARILLEPLTGPARDGESVEEFLTRKFGREAAHRYFAPLYTGLYGSHPDEMLVQYSLGKALDRAGIEGSIVISVAKMLLRGREPPPIVSFEDGLQRLPEAIYERYSDRVHLETPVEAVREAGDGYELVTADGPRRVDAVGLTAPAGVTADLIAEVDPTADDLRDLNYNPLAVVHLESDLNRRGQGYQVLPEAGYRTLGTTWNATMLDRDGLYTAYLGSGRDPDLVDENLDDIGRIAASEFEAITGAPADALNVHVVRPGMPAYDRSWRALDDLRLEPGLELCSNYTARAGVVGRLHDAKATAATLAEQA